MRRLIWLSGALAAIGALLLAAALAMSGSGDGDDPGAEEPASVQEVPSPQPQPPADSGPQLTPTLEERFSPVVLSYVGLNNLVVGEPVTSEGLEFVMGAPRDVLERVEGITVHLPDGTTREMFPSTDLGVGLDFFGYYGSGDGLPPPGDYTFEVRMKDGTTLDVVNQYEGGVLALPENVVADIDREVGTIRVSWDPVVGIRNYTVDLQEINPADRSYTFVEGVGCPDPATVDPNALDASYWTETYCEFSGLGSLLDSGKEYGIQIAVWGDENNGYPSYGGIDGAVLFTW